ncbi:MAG: PAAR-like protein [Bacteroidales bacterium]
MEEEWKFIHKVKKGDGLWKVATQHNVKPWTSLAARNGLKCDANLEVGQELLVPNSNGECCRPAEVDNEAEEQPSSADTSEVAIDKKLRKISKVTSSGAIILKKKKLKLKETLDRTVDKKGMEGYLVCDGATFSCNQGSEPKSVAKAFMNRKVVIADNKPVMTTGDTSILSFNFKNCKAKNNSPCAPNVNWKDFYGDIDIGMAGNPLLSCSSGNCSLGGGIISIKKHGQGGDVSAAMETRMGNGVFIYTASPLLSASEKAEKPSVDSISGKYTKGGEVKDVSGKKTYEIERTQDGVSVELKAKLSNNGGDANLVNWIIHRDVEGTFVQYKLYANYGETFDFNTKDIFVFDGIYKIECYGWKCSSSLNSCSVVINYQSNKPISIEMPKGDLAIKDVYVNFRAKYSYDSKDDPLDSKDDPLNWSIIQLYSDQSVILYIENSDGVVVNNLPAPKMKEDKLNFAYLLHPLTKNPDGSIDIVFFNSGTYLISATDKKKRLGFRKKLQLPKIW